MQQRGGVRTGSPGKLLENCDMTDAENTDGKKYVMGDVWVLCFLCLCRVSGRVAGGCVCVSVVLKRVCLLVVCRGAHLSGGFSESLPGCVG